MGGTNSRLESATELDLTEVEINYLCCTQGRNDTGSRQRKCSQKDVRKIGLGDSTATEIFKSKPSSEQASEWSPVIHRRTSSYINLQQNTVLRSVGKISPYSFTGPNAVFVNGTSYVSASPDGWSAEQLLELNNLVQDASFVFRSKPPSIAALKVVPLYTRMPMP